MYIRMSCQQLKGLLSALRKDDEYEREKEDFGRGNGLIYTPLGAETVGSSRPLHHVVAGDCERD
jgi:hypothetical protein